MYLFLCFCIPENLTQHETQILKTYYWYQKCVEKNTNVLSFVHTQLLETNIVGVS